LYPKVAEDEASVQNKARPGEYHLPWICLSYPARLEVLAAIQLPAREHGQAAVPPWNVKRHAAAEFKSIELLWRRFSASAPAALRHSPLKTCRRAVSV
jgi:hypothetical protein